MDTELLEGPVGLNRARADARKRTKTSHSDGKNAFQRNLLRQMEGQSKIISSAASSMSKLAEAHTSSKESSTSSSITSNQELMIEIEAIRKAVDAGVYDEDEAAQQIAEAKAALKSHQARKASVAPVH